MNKQIERYKEFATKIEAKYNQEPDNYLGLQGDIFTVLKELPNKKQSIVFSFKVSRAAYHSYHYTNYAYLSVNNEKVKTLHIKKTFVSKLLPIKNSYSLVDSSNSYGVSIIELMNKYQIEVVEEIFYSKSLEHGSTISIKCNSTFLELQELMSLYDFVIDVSNIL
ncbi:hypothetical protein [Bernardetia sp.]|uniref:hypothetical protein n=1 Tax=Bernardetia sp. TaxID=1937974 RepID=UPI0025B87903|nr:hypothetical protein [Bernardetia sp.]